MLKHFRPIYWLVIALLVVIIYGQVQFELGLADKMGDITGLIQSQATAAEIWDVGKEMLLYTLGSVILKMLFKMKIKREKLNLKMYHFVIQMEKDMS